MTITAKKYVDFDEDTEVHIFSDALFSADL